MVTSVSTHLLTTPWVTHGLYSSDKESLISKDVKECIIDN